MVTELLDKEGIANVVKTDLEAGGLGNVMGTSPLGDPWRIEVPADQYDRALELYESVLGQSDEAGEDDDDEDGRQASGNGWCAGRRCVACRGTRAVGNKGAANCALRSLRTVAFPCNFSYILRNRLN